MHYPVQASVAILGAVDFEVEPLGRQLSNARVLEFRGEKIWTGTMQDRSVLIATTGVGKVNAAISTAALLESFEVDEVWNVGCSGAYKGGLLEIGDVLVTETSILGDEGVKETGGILSSSEIGFPVLRLNGREIFDSIPLSGTAAYERIIRSTPPGKYAVGEGGFPSAKPSGDAGEAGAEFRLVYGPSLTVGMSSGDAAVSSERYHHYGALAENMEGSAVAQACFRFEVPVIECRGVSNHAGDRRSENWDLGRAISNCHCLLRLWIADWKSGTE